MVDEIFLRRNELLKRRLDVVEIDIRDEAVNASIDASRRGPMHIPSRRHQIGQHFEISKGTHVSGGRRVAAARILPVIAMSLGART
jgi:hypothetical protein